MISGDSEVDCFFAIIVMVSAIRIFALPCLVLVFFFGSMPIGDGFVSIDATVRIGRNPQVAVGVRPKTARAAKGERERERKKNGRERKSLSQRPTREKKERKKEAAVAAAKKC